MFSYSELSAAMPKIGGEYTYVKAAFGGFLAFISGCFRWLASVFGAALAAASFTLQFAYFFSFFSPGVNDFILAQMPLITVISVLILAALDIKGVKKLQTIIVVVSITIFAVFIASGLLRGLPPIEIIPKTPIQDLPGILAASVYLFPMFFGMRSIIAGAALIKNPGKNVPRGILLSAILIIPFYLGIAYVAAGLISPGDIPSAPFLNFAAQKIMGVTGGVLFSVAGMVASLSALSTSLTVQSSIVRGMSRDGYLPKVLLSIHRRFDTPYVAILSGSVFVMFLSAIGSIEFLGYAASFGSLLIFALVNISLLKLRKEKPDIERPFKTPLYPLTPIAGFIIPLVLLLFPIFLQDIKAVSALTSAVVLTIFVLMTYYIRMIEGYRLQIAVGGAAIGLGLILFLITSLALAGFITAIFPYILSFVLIGISVIIIISGFLNVIAGGKKEKELKGEKV
jgi:amino acid transporter